MKTSKGKERIKEKLGGIKDTKGAVGGNPLWLELGKLRSKKLSPRARVYEPSKIHPEP